MGLHQFERRLERLVEGVFARASRSGLQPVELARRMTREMDAERTLGVRGTVAPNHFTFLLSASDVERFSVYGDSLHHQLAEAAREHARDEGYVFMGPVSVHLELAEKQHAGSFQIVGRMREGKGGAGAGSLLLPTGERLQLGESVVTVGRKPESTLQLGDPNVSRNHAEIRPHGNGWVLVDLGSTNGSRVNGNRVSSHELHEGDEIAFGNTILRFEAS
jgi:hypothetical protein